MRYFILVTQFLNGALLIRFSLSKLLAWPISVKAFIEMAKPLGVDPTIFRIFTGVIITVACVSYLSGFIFTLKDKTFNALKYKRFTQFSNICGISVMIGALIAEFFLRNQPKWPLVAIALFIIVTSVINLFSLNKND